MKKGKLMLSSIIAGALLFTSSASCVFAAETDSAAKTYENMKVEESGKYDIPEKIKENGKTYKLTGYEVVKGDNVEVTKKEKVADRESFKPDQIIKHKSVSGKTLQLKLKDIEWKTNEVHSMQEYKSRNEVPESFDKEVELEGSDQKATVTMYLADAVDKSRTDDFTATAKFYAQTPQTTMFEFNGKTVTADASPTWDGYKDDVKAVLGVNGNTYDITGGQWSSGFIKEGDRYVRTATYTGTKQIPLIEATYNGSVYEAKLIYTGFDPDKGAEIIASYDRVFGAKEVIMIGAGVVILAIAAATILFIIRRRRESEE